MDFMLARPYSNSLPSRLFMLTNLVISLATKGWGPGKAHLTFVEPPLASSVNSAMLWPSKGLKKSSLIVTLEGGDVSTISMRPWPALPLPAHSYTAALAVCRAAVGPLHRGVELLIGRPGAPPPKVIDEREELFRWCLDALRALDTERVWLGCGKAEKRRNQNAGSDSNYVKRVRHGFLQYVLKSSCLCY